MASSLEDRVSRNAATKAPKRTRKAYLAERCRFSCLPSRTAVSLAVAMTTTQRVAKRLTFPTSSNSQILENISYHLNQFSLIATLTIELFIIT